MSLNNWPHDATPEEAAAYKLGKNESARQIRICAQRVIEYELALNSIRRATDQHHAFNIASNALARHKANK